ncbi:hypothetical protein Q2T40_00220 [Winogradskyella maritima]|nr:hypothetical protein [Winogradskyella maritima]
MNSNVPNPKKIIAAGNDSTALVYRFFGIFHIGTGQVPLYDGLVRSLGNQSRGQTADKRYPKCGLGKSEIHIGHIEFVTFGGIGNHISKRGFGI